MTPQQTARESVSLRRSLAASRSGRSSSLQRKDHLAEPREVCMKFRTAFLMFFVATFLAPSFADCHVSQSKVSKPRPRVQLATLPSSVTISYTDSKNWLATVPDEEPTTPIR